MLSHFLHAVFISGCLFKVLREKRIRETPAGQKAETAPGSLRVAECLQRKSAPKFNRASKKTLSILLFIKKLL
jgi:hypothetical protein